MIEGSRTGLGWTLDLGLSKSAVQLLTAQGFSVMALCM